VGSDGNDSRRGSVVAERDAEGNAWRRTGGKHQLGGEVFGWQFAWPVPFDDPK